ncbi:MAG TPA: hypothetical protein VF699_12695 [Caulobacteraceae bacterium]|jgi:hypothetical protein
MTETPVPLSAVRAAWRELRETLRREHRALGFTAPRLGRSEDGLAVVVEARAVGVGADWIVRVEVPLNEGALRLWAPLLRVLERLARAEIRRSAVMTCEEWTEVQGAARLGLAIIRRGDGWEAEITAAGAEALRRGWIP